MLDAHLAGARVPAESSYVIGKHCSAVCLLIASSLTDFASVIDYVVCSGGNEIGSHGIHEATRVIDVCGSNHTSKQLHTFSSNLVFTPSI
jgi:hypothetical protein